MGLIDPRAVKFSRLRWTLFPIRTFGAFRAAVWAGIQRPDEAVAAADARRHPAAGTPTALETTGLPAPASALAASAGSAVTTTADRTGTAGRPRRTGGTSRYAVAGARSDAALTAALAEVPRDADGTVPVRRAAAALRCGPDRARRLLAAAGLLRTTAPVPPTTIPTAVPDAAPEQMPAAA